MFIAIEKGNNQNKLHKIGIYLATLKYTPEEISSQKKTRRNSVKIHSQQGPKINKKEPNQMLYSNQKSYQIQPQ